MARQGTGKKVGQVTGSENRGKELALIPAPPALKFIPYPPALAKYDDIIADRSLFMRTLKKLHETMKTKFMIPVMGGKQLDLHRLFMEVTFRGGLETTVKNKKWKDVTLAFNFPPTATNASFVLRKFYLALLHHYEQIYFYGAKERASPSSFCQTPSTKPVPDQAASRPLLPSQNVQALASQKIRGTEKFLPSQDIHASASRKRKDTGKSVLPEVEAPVSHKRRSTGKLFPEGIPSPLVGSKVSGVIDSKIKNGYLVTVKVGTENLQGVLYHLNEQPSSPQNSGVVTNIGEKSPTVSGVCRCGRPRKSDIPKGQPPRKSDIQKGQPSHLPNCGHQKTSEMAEQPQITPYVSGYNFFFMENYDKLKQIHLGKGKEVKKIITDLWNKLTKPQKAVYQARGIQRYEREMAEKKKRSETGPIITPAIPIQQRLPAPAVTMVEAGAKAGTGGSSIDKSGKGKRPQQK